MNAAYDEIADWYENEFLPYQRWGSEDREFADTIGVDEGLTELLGPGVGTCLEVGCGTGIYAERVRALGRHPVGVDISAAMLSSAADRLPVARGDALRLPVGSATLDAVIGVMIHSDLPAFGPVVDEVHRVLRPGGVFVHIGVHPCFTGRFADRSDPEAAIISPGYLDEGWTPPLGPTVGQVGTSGQVRNKVGAAHYPLASLLNRFIDAGFEVQRVFEGGAPTPITLSLRLVKPAL